MTDAPVGGSTAQLPVGVVVRRTPGVSRWAKWHYQPIAVLPGAGPAHWKTLREAENGEADYHAATVTLEVHRSETESYKVALSNEPPSVWVVLRPNEDETSDAPFIVHMVTASPHEAQDYLDSGEELVEPVPAPPGLVAWLRAFTDAHHREEPFKKRRRDRLQIDQSEDGKGDARIRQLSDVYRAPRRGPAAPGDDEPDNTPRTGSETLH